MKPKQKRPVGVTLLACVFLWIGCLGTVFFPIIAIFGGISMAWRLIASGVIHSEFWLRLTSYLFCTIWYAFYVAYAFIGFGLWKLRNWARKSVLAVSLFSIAISLFAVPFLVKPWDFGVAIAIGMVPPFAWIAWYVNRPRVRFAFEAWPSAQEWAATTVYPAGLSKVGKACVLAGLLATFALFIGTVMVNVENTFHSSEIYKISLTEAQNSPCVATILGSPLTPGWGTSGSMEESGMNGSAILNIPVRGPRGKATLDLTAKKHNGVWKINSLVLVYGIGQIQILPGAAPADCH